MKTIKLFLTSLIIAHSINTLCMGSRTLKNLAKFTLATSTLAGGSYLSYSKFAYKDTKQKHLKKALDKNKITLAKILLAADIKSDTLQQVLIDIFEKDDPVAIELLLSKIDKNLEFSAKKTAYENLLIEACHKNSANAVKKLLDLGINNLNINFQKDGETPLIIAANTSNFVPLHKSIPIAKKLIKNGANINIVDNNNNSALIIFCKGYTRLFLNETITLSYDRNKIITKLVKSGAEVNLINKEGYTPLMYASINEWHPIVKLLLENGAKLDITNALGETALDLAQKFNDKNSHESVINLLKSYS